MGESTFVTMARTFTITLTLLLCSALFLSASVSAEEIDPTVASVEDDVEKEAKDEMTRMDADKDSKVSLDEVKAYFRKEFYSDEDMKESTEGTDGKPPTAVEITELVTELDKSKDGFLDLEELKEQYKTDGDDLEEEDTQEPEDEDDGDEDAGDMDIDDE